MGYPMTWRRFVNRNGLGDGDYEKVPVQHAAHVNTELIRDDDRANAYPHLAERIDAYEKAFQTLAGDLRRLERDAQDEGGICSYIAGRTALPRDVVAAVLKEFVTW